MGPLAGQGIITPEFDYILALIIGIAFGFILEQAGFSSSKRLAALFYGTNFVVLRVFFTAAITTVTGSIFLEYFGLLDMNLVYINPTFVWSIILGGVIMGIGFIMGGFCPGTSICAVGIGKIDAIFFAIGLFIGVFIFAELYPLISTIYYANNLGGIFVYDSLGISRGFFAAVLIAMAVFAFIVTYYIEQSINKTPQSLNISTILAKPYHTAGIAIALILAIIVLVTPSRYEKLYAQAQNPGLISNNTFLTISSIELAYKIIQQDKSILIIDVREETDFATVALPNSINIAFSKLSQREWETIFENLSTQKIIIANTELEQKQAILLLEALGYKQLRMLIGGFHEFTNQILEYQPTNNTHSKAEHTFILDAKQRIGEMILQGKKPIIEKKVLSKAKGGC